MPRPTVVRLVAGCLAAVVLAGCGAVWNDPYPAADRGSNTLYTSFVERPKTLDPARAYTSDEWDFLAQVLEPPLQYHYLKRPYTLIPQSAAAMPSVRYLDAAGEPLPDDADAKSVATSEYEIRIRPGIRYAPHPAFAAGPDGKPRYLDLTPEEVARHAVLGDFRERGTRELLAEDYVYQIKRLASPRTNSPVLGHLSEYVVGLKELGETLKKANERIVAEHRTKHGPVDKGLPWLDLRAFPLAGVTVVDSHTYRVRIKGKYPQFAYWLAMPFFAPMPHEADRFHAQRGMNEGRNVTLDWYPVGTGPYMLTVNNPNARMELVRNPEYRGEPFPSEGEPGDREAGLLADAGKMAPFIDRVVYTREKEGIPYWNKFLQGYYDQSGISSDNFDQAVQVGVEGQATITPEMEAKGIRLRTSVGTSTYYLAFNFADPVVGGLGDPARKIRQALSIAVDWEEFISIFSNGRGLPGQSPLPPGIFGYRDGPEGINPVVYDVVDGKPRRKPVEAAKQLLAEAGFPDGRDAKTGQPLVLYLDTVTRGPGDKARLDWYRRQFAKISIQLEIRASDWNRFQEKVRTGNTQLFFLGWNADYPDPENFLFLLNGPQAMKRTGGENKSNYVNPEYDRLFEQMKNLENGPERQAIIDRMVELVRIDAPWLFAFHPLDYALSHAWLSNQKPNQMARNGLKFARLDPAMRETRRAEWNRPVTWPMIALAVLLVVSLVPAWVAWRRRETAVASRAVARSARAAGGG